MATTMKRLMTADIAALAPQAVYECKGSGGKATIEHSMNIPGFGLSAERSAGLSVDVVVEINIEAY